MTPAHELVDRQADSLCRICISNAAMTWETGLPNVCRLLDLAALRDNAMRMRRRSRIITRQQSNTAIDSSSSTLSSSSFAALSLFRVESDRALRQASWTIRVIWAIWATCVVAVRVDEDASRIALLGLACFAAFGHFVIVRDRKVRRIMTDFLVAEN